MVRPPQARRRLAGWLVGSAAALVGGPGSDILIRGALILLACLAVPQIGIGLAVAAFAVGVAIYFDMVQNGDETDRRFGVDWRRVRKQATPVGVVGCLLVGAAVVLPLWAWRVGPARPPHLDRLGLLTLGLGCISLPLLAVARASRGSGLRARDGLLCLVRHPVATLLILAVVPAALLATEGLLLACICETGALAIFGVDFMPLPGGMTEFHGYFHRGDRLFSDLPTSEYLASYLRGLQQGRSWVGSIPASLSLSSRAGIRFVPLPWTPASYAIVRLVLSFIVAVALVVGFAIQARCLGVLVHARKHRLA